MRSIANKVACCALALLVGFVLFCPGTGYSRPNPTMSYQGRLTDKAGTPLSGQYKLTFQIWSDSTAGVVVWEEAQSAVAVTDGLFSVLLGSTSPIDAGIFVGNPSRFLSVQVSGEPEIIPRTRLTFAPYAFTALSADVALSAAAYLPLTGGTVAGHLTVSGGNLNLDNSSATAGSILKGGWHFIHNFGYYNTFLGVSAGNMTMTGGTNTGMGAQALDNVTAGSENTAAGVNALGSCTSGSSNTAVGVLALSLDTSGTGNTAVGWGALEFNRFGSYNTAVGYGANVFSSHYSFTNATAIGANAIVNASNKIRLGDSGVTVIEGQVAYTFTSDRNLKENFRSVDGSEVLRKIRSMSLTSWNYKGNDPRTFRHYGPVAQEFYAAFGNDSVGACGDSTTINSGDMAGILMIAVQELEKRTAEIRTIRDENAELKMRIERLEAKLDRLIGSTSSDGAQLGMK